MKQQILLKKNQIKMYQKIQTYLLFVLCSLFISTKTIAQSCNQNTGLISGNFSNLSTASSGCLLLYGACGEANLIDANTNNSAQIIMTALQIFPMWLEVRANSDIFNAGTYAGFEISSNSLVDLGLFDDITITTFLNGTKLEEKSGSNLFIDGTVFGASGKHTIGFVTSQPYNRIRITVSGVKLGVATTNVYQAIVKQFCEGPALPCNSYNILTIPDYPLTVDESKSGVIGIGLGNSIVNLNNILDANKSNYTTINKPTGGLASTVMIAVEKHLSKFGANTFAGFDLETVGLVDVGVLDAIKVELYRNDTLVQSAIGGELVNIGIPLIIGSGRRTVGMLAKQPYDEIRLSINYGLANVGLLSSTRVYGLVINQFCNGLPLTCNMPASLYSPDYPVYVDGKHTGISGVGNVGTINNWNNAIDNDPLTVATITQVVGLFSTATFTIGDALTIYPKNTYAGIEISTAQLLDVALLNNYKVQLLKDGNVVQTSNPSTLLVNVNSSILTGTTRQIVGIVSDTTFNEVKLIIEKPVGVDLGIVKVHGAVFENLCPAVLTCNQSPMLQYGSHPVVINASRTGVLGIANVGSDVKNPENVLDSDNTKYAEISTVANALTKASISVVNPIQTYPAGTFAGFIVRNANGLIDLGILNGMSIKTYNNGVLQESRSGGNLIDLTLLINIFGPGNEARNIGFITTKPFDEVQISMGELVGVLSTIRVYGAFIDTRSSIGDGLNCYSTYPDFNVTYVNVPVTGDVSTNDKIVPGTTYGTPSIRGNNPSADLPTINNDGTYSFVTSVSGTYQFNVPVCLPGQVNGCATEKLTITVLDPYINNNPPVANDDIAFTKGSPSNPSPVTISVKSNDKPGNLDGTLGTPSVVTPSVNGNTTVDINGNIVYTPNDNFYGKDSFAYQVCETPSALCDTAWVFVYVLPNSIPNTTLAADDYTTTPKNKQIVVSASNGVLSNDTDPEGDSQFVVAKNDTIAGKGILNLNADGSYTFTPETNFVGPVEFEYTVNDDNATSASAKATLHILVTETTLSTRPDFNVTYVNVPVNGDVSTNDLIPAGTTYGNIVPFVTNPTADLPVMNSNGKYTFITSEEGSYQFYVSACLPGQSSDCMKEKLTIFVFGLNNIINPPLANNDIATVIGDPIVPHSVTIPVKKNDAPSNENGILGTPNYVTPPTNGIISVDTNDNIVYTPNPNFYEKDSFSYQICENLSGLCDTAWVYVYVLPPNTPNSTLAVDDYAYTNMDVQLVMSEERGVLANDIDPEGNRQYVIAKIDTVDGKGILNLNTNGSYTFTPAPGYVGPVEFEYSIIDDGIPQAASTATIHILVAPSTPLPLNLTSFTAIEKSCGNVEINWVTEKEINIKQFNVEYSLDNLNFNTLRTVPANNNINSHTYSVSNTQNSRIAYYRLKVIDNDNSYFYSRTQKVTKAADCNAIDAVVLYPNPASDVVYLSSLKGTETIKVYNLMGQQVLTVESNQGLNIVNIASLTNGTYTLVIIDDENSEKLVLKLTKL